MITLAGMIQNMAAATQRERDALDEAYRRLRERMPETLPHDQVTDQIHTMRVGIDAVTLQSLRYQSARMKQETLEEAARSVQAGRQADA